MIDFSLLAKPVIGGFGAVMTELCSFVQNKHHELYGVGKEIKKLSNNLSTIQGVLEDAERCLPDSNSEQLRSWLTNLEDVALDVEDILQTYATEAPLREKQKFQAPLAWFCFRSKAAKMIKDAVKRMDMISKAKQDFHFRGSDYVNKDWRAKATRDDLLEVREMNCLRDTSEIIGREKEKEKVVSWLLSDQSDIAGVVPVLAITGMGGVGKTTLAQLVYNDQRVYKKKDETCHFKVAMWINLSMDSSVDKILREMVEILTEMRHDTMPQSVIEQRILEVLDGKRFLLILDDVWPEKLAWGPLHRVLKLCPSGSKVLVTSRNEEVVMKMGALHTQHLDLLPEEECWNLFVKRAFTTGTCPRDLEDIGRKIVLKCKFLPLAVKAMACLLCEDTNVRNWEKILKHDVWELEPSHSGNEKYILPALKLSYDHLQSQLKQCFAYCCIFPKGYLFDKNELVKLWLAEGYIKPVATDKIEETGSCYFEELLKRSFFQPLDVNDKEKCNMHDLYHDLAKSVSSFCQQIEENKSISIKLETRHISFSGKDTQKLAEEVLIAQKLRTLLLPTPAAKDFGKMLDKMLRTLSCLRVLDLSSSTIKYLPDSIGKLKLLGHLDLSRTEIRALPDTICNLRNLQILKLLGCLWLWELPKDLCNLKNLQYLELDDIFWYKCSALPPRIGGITNLHNLHAFHVRQESGYGMEELQFMKNLEGILHISNLENSDDATSAELKEKENISGLVLEWSNKDADQQERIVQERVLEHLEPHHGLQKLQINHFRGNQFSSWMGILHNLQEVSLNHCINCRLLSLGPLPHLRVLRIKGMLELEQWPETMYESLIRLSISNCPLLAKLPGNFPNLKVAKIKKCDALTAFPMTPSLMFLRLIDNAMLKDFDEAWVGEHGVVFIIRGFNLLELQIINCPRLEELPQIFAPQKLEISGCSSLRTLPHPHNSQRLQCLELDKCIGPSMIEAIPSTSSLYSLVISNLRYMYSLPQFPHLPGLKALYINSCQDLVSLSYPDGLLEHLPSLKLLSISGCRKLLTFTVKDLPTSIEWLSIKDCSELRSFHPRNCLASLTSLKDLYLEDCPKLVLLPEDGLPANLQHLSIRGCPLLTQKCSEHTSGKYWPMIRHIADLEIDFLQTPEPQVSATPKKGCCSCFRA